MAGSDPAGGSACENTHAPTPSLGRPRAGSLPSTSVLPSAAQAAGWQRPQLQAPARDSRIRCLRIFTGAMRESTPHVVFTAQWWHETQVGHRKCAPERRTVCQVMPR